MQGLFEFSRLADAERLFVQDAGGQTAPGRSGRDGRSGDASAGAAAEWLAADGRKRCDGGAIVRVGDGVSGGGGRLDGGEAL